jgi:hypothetical protein
VRRWARWIALGLLGVAVAAYAADWLVFNLRGSVTSTVTVSRFLSAPLKNNKQELDYLGSEDVPCSVSLLPEGGHLPCWYLRRHKNQVTNI